MKQQEPTHVTQQLQDVPAGGLTIVRNSPSGQGYVLLTGQFSAKTVGKVFKATGGAVKLTKNGKSIQFLFEVFRRENDWQKKLVEKMNLYKDFYENFVPGDSGFAGIPQLIFVCEDEKHMAECFKEIITNKVEIPQIKMLFTTDLRQNEETLANTLVEFKLVDGKYKMENVELKLIG